VRVKATVSLLSCQERWIMGSPREAAVDVRPSNWIFEPRMLRSDVKRLQ
jgi:hypothetical protein